MQKYLLSAGILTETVSCVYLIFQKVHTHFLYWLYLVLVSSIQQRLDVVAVDRDAKKKRKGKKSISLLNPLCLFLNFYKKKKENFQEKTAKVHNAFWI